MIHRHLKPYARRHHPGDKSETWRCAIRLAYHIERFGEGNFYVLVQHGAKGLAIDAAATKRALFKDILGVQMGTMSKNGKDWCRIIHRGADRRTKIKRARRKAAAVLRRAYANASRESGKILLVGADGKAVPA